MPTELDALTAQIAAAHTNYDAYDARTFTITGDAKIDGCVRVHALPHDLVIGTCQTP